MRKKPTADEGAHNSYEEVADDSEPGALHDLPSQPSGDETDQQYDQETFTRHVHIRILQTRQLANEFPPASSDASPIIKNGVAKANIRLSKEEGMILPVLFKPLQRPKLLKIDQIKGAEPRK